MKRRYRLWIVYALSLVLAACSLLYELLIAQSLAFLAGNMVVWYSLTVGTYIGAMGLGALVQGSRAEGSAWARLHLIEVLLSIVGALAATFIHLAHTVQLYLLIHELPGTSLVVFFGSTASVILAVGFLTGIELPLLIRLGNEVSSEGNVTNRVLGFDYIGALVAGVAFPMLLLPNLELVTIGFVTAAVNLICAAGVLYVASPGQLAPSRVSATLAVGFLILVGIVNAGDIQQYMMKRYYYYFEHSETLGMLLGSMDRPDVFRVSSPYQKIDLVHDEESTTIDHVIKAYSTRRTDRPDLPRDRYLFLNGDYQLASNYEEVYHEWFAHVPLILNGKVPRRVLVLGAGDGLLIRELVKYRQLAEIVHVDLDPALIELARTHPVFTALNDHALDDPRVNTIVGDAYQYVRKSSEVFDAIYMDFPDVVDYNLSKLYSREFLTFVMQRLAPDGYAVYDADIKTKGPKPDWDVYHHTLKATGFGTVVSYRSELESDNPVAGELLEELYEDEGPLSKQETVELLAEAITAIHQFFVVAWKPADRKLHDYQDLGVRLHVLNERRFRMSFGQLPRLSSFDARRVNSIMRPTLPTIPMWFVRRAWGPYSGAEGAAAVDGGPPPGTRAAESLLEDAIGLR